jgi:ring-1,2-phenylacetyl-CoA epoxidase subunit PaaE
MASLLTKPAGRRGRFHPLTVSRVERLTEGAVAIWFSVPDELATDFTFEPGQYLTLRAVVDGQRVQRSYSICLSRHEAVASKQLRVAAARVGGGLLSNWINDYLVAGQQLEVMTPLGRFTSPTDPDSVRHHVAIVAGSGVTPLMSLFPTILAEEPASRATLVFGNRDTRSIMFRRELEDLEAAYPGRLRVIHVLSREAPEPREAPEADLLHGRLDRGRIDRILATLVPVPGVDQWYLCGPSGLVETGRRLLADLGVDREHVHHEVFDVDEDDPQT